MSIPKGFKLVPVEPTLEMQESVRDAWESEGAISAKQMYKAMLDAAPTPPQPIYDMATELYGFIEFASDKAWFSPVLKDADDVKMQFQEEFTDAIWIGWLACAQSRAKAVEVGHE